MNCQCNIIQELEGSEAQVYANEHLRKAKVHEWKVDYICPNTGILWLMDYPHGELMGGGWPRLRKQPIPIDINPINCRCQEVMIMDGIEAIKYADLHLQIINIGKTEIEYGCPDTGIHWLMDYPKDILLPGGVPRLRKLPPSPEDRLLP